MSYDDDGAGYRKMEKDLLLKGLIEKTKEARALKAEIEQLKTGIREYACTGTDHPCGCYNQFLSERAKIERLTAALARYGDHEYECEMKNGGGCSCGYDAALKDTKPSTQDFNSGGPR